jgi:plasmid stabilization system protein ParE
MACKLVITPSARTALLDIISYYFLNFSPDAADKVDTDFLNLFAAIAERPLANKVLENAMLVRPNLRRAVLNNTYIVIYEVDGDTVVILDIYHGSRDPVHFKR